MLGTDDQIKLGCFVKKEKEIVLIFAGYGQILSLFLHDKLVRLTTANVYSNPVGLRLRVCSPNSFG
jgi:hypothetical protein